jgi:hypothetical protein|tara:strand:+ start:1652 stop:1921 length:270 start_codon:yes stop_codon:yes gene_type:complete
MATEKNNRTGFPSLYRATYEEGWVLKNTGYDYTNTLLNKTMSNYMFRNPHLKKFLEDYLNPIMVYYVNRVKYLRIFFNFAVPKYYQKIN